MHTRVLTASCQGDSPTVLSLNEAWPLRSPPTDDEWNTWEGLFFFSLSAGTRVALWESSAFKVCCDIIYSTHRRRPLVRVYVAFPDGCVFCFLWILSFLLPVYICAVVIGRLSNLCSFMFSFVLNELFESLIWIGWKLWKRWHGWFECSVITTVATETSSCSSYTGAVGDLRRTAVVSCTAEIIPAFENLLNAAAEETFWSVFEALIKVKKVVLSLIQFNSVWLNPVCCSEDAFLYEDHKQNPPLHPGV